MSTSLPFLAHIRGRRASCEFKASPTFVDTFDAMTTGDQGRIKSIEASFAKNSSTNQDTLWTHQESMESFWLRQRHGFYVMYRKVGGLQRFPTIELWHCGRYADEPAGRRFDFEDDGLDD